MNTVSEAQKAAFKNQAFARGNDKELIGVLSLVQIEGQANRASRLIREAASAIDRKPRCRPFSWLPFEPAFAQRPTHSVNWVNNHHQVSRLLGRQIKARDRPMPASIYSRPPMRTGQKYMGAADEAVTAFEMGTSRHPSSPKTTLRPCPNQ